MAGTLFCVDSVQVFIGAEDHPPPHVHAAQAGDGWVARFRFSFLSDVTGLYRFRRRGRRPTLAMLERVADAIMQGLLACRESWWRTQGHLHELGLVNRRIETRETGSGDGVLARIALKPGRLAVGIVAATYDPGREKIALTLADGRRLLLTAGQHIGEAEEW